jgi:hypothetical protein
VNSLYLGDYDQTVSDFTLANRGFVGAYQIISPHRDPDLKAMSLP